MATTAPKGDDRSEKRRRPFGKVTTVYETEICATGSLAGSRGDPGRSQAGTPVAGMVGSALLVDAQTRVSVCDPAARLRFGPVRLRGRFGVPCPPGPEVILSLSQINLAKSRGQKIGRQPSGTPPIAFQILFPVAIDWVLGKQQEKRGVNWVPETKRYCDIAENTRDLQPLVTNIVRLQTALGSASGPKAINMLIGTHAPLRSVTIDENKLKVAENFTYLGSSINKMDNELDCRPGKASAAFNQLGFETYYVEISQEKRLESLDASDSECFGSDKLYQGMCVCMEHGSELGPLLAGSQVMATPLHVVQELKKQFGAMKQGRTTDIREDLVRYAGRPVEAFDPQGPGPRGGAGISKSQLYPAQCLEFLVMEADSVRLAFRLPERKKILFAALQEGGLNEQSMPAAVVDAHVDNTNVISAGDNQWGGKASNYQGRCADNGRRCLHAVESQRSGCPASRLTKASDVMLNRKVFQRIDAELGGVSGFDTDLMVSPSSVQSARDGRNLRFLRPYPTPYSEGPYNSPSKFCDATEGEGGVGGTGQVPQVLLVANCGKSAGSLRGLTSAILTEEKWWLAVKAGNSLAPQGARGSAGSQAMAPGSKTGRTRKGRRKSKRRSELRQRSTPQQAKPVFLGKVVQVCEAIPEKRTSGKSAVHNGRDQAIFKVAFFSGDRLADLLRTRTAEGVKITVRRTEKTGDSYVGPGEAIGWSMAIAKYLSIELEGGYLF
ncbi:hypothetical protein Bbelb_192760 [Branchiostoma belcheri]|nr:hypothetical protein Bbelb_192760 [Branchiostoma belcheri]